MNTIKILILNNSYAFWNLFCMSWFDGIVWELLVCDLVLLWNNYYIIKLSCHWIQVAFTHYCNSCKTLRTDLFYCNYLRLSVLSLCLFITTLDKCKFSVTITTSLYGLPLEILENSWIFENFARARKLLENTILTPTSGKLLELILSICIFVELKNFNTFLGCLFFFLMHTLSLFE